MPLTRAEFKDIIIDSVREVYNDLTVEEEDEIADLALKRIVDEVPELFEEEDEEDEDPEQDLDA